MKKPQDALSTRDYSNLQEHQIAKFLGGKVQSNSGGTKFGGGDVHTKKFLIEAKTPTKAQESFSVKKEWIEKADQQAYEQNKPFSSVAFRFDPDDPHDYYVINDRLMGYLLEYLEKENSNE